RLHGRLPARRAEHLSSQPSQLHETDLLDASLKAAGLSRKELAYVWGVKRQQVDKIINGIAPGPMRRQIELYTLLESRGQAHRIPEIARYTLDRFGVIVLDGDEAEAFRKIRGMK